MADSLNSAMATAQDAQRPAATPTEATPEEPAHVQSKREQWEQLKASLAHWKEQANRNEKLLAEREQRDQLVQDTERVTERLDSAETKLAKALVERDPRFQAKFDAPISAARAEVERLVNGDEFLDDTDKEWVLASLLEHQPGPWRKEELLKATDYAEDSGTAILSAIRKYDEAVKARSADLEQNATTAAQHMAKTSLDAQFAQRQQHERDVQTMIDKALAMAREEHEFFRPSDDPEQDKFAKESAAGLERFLRGELSPEELFLMQPKAAGYDWLAPKYAEALKLKAQLEEAVASYQVRNTFHRAAAPTPTVEYPHEASSQFVADFTRRNGR